MTSKEQYLQLCQEKSDICIYDQPWWLDFVCGPENWDVLLYEKKGQILGAMPYYVKKRYGLSYVTVPLLTQHNWIYVRYPEQQKYEAKLALEKEVYSELLTQLEGANQGKLKYVQISMYPELTNLLPFYWKGYQGRTSYTYMLSSSRTSYEELEKNFSKVIRYDAKKALEVVQIEESNDLEAFYQLHTQMFARQGQKARFSLDYFQQFDAVLSAHGARRLLIARNQDGIPYSAAYFIYDQTTVYYLLSGTDPAYRKYNTLTALITEGIRFACQTKRDFDFEGSMIETIESYFRKFGAHQVPYFHVHKVLTKNPVLKSLLEKY